jgi:hypothetical protein
MLLGGGVSAIMYARGRILVSMGAGCIPCVVTEDAIFSPFVTVRAYPLKAARTRIREPDQRYDERNSPAICRLSHPPDHGSQSTPFSFQQYLCQFLPLQPRISVSMPVLGVGTRSPSFSQVVIFPVWPA